jgi:formylglycine-generating enzyme required for sulfatase activity
MSTQRAIWLLGIGLLCLDSSSAIARRGPPETVVSGLSLVRIPAGLYRPLYRTSASADTVSVAAFMLMSRPVTNGEFLAFVTAHGAYRRDQIARVLADERYLSHWQGALALGAAARSAQPVTRVSWFAAKAFCTDHGLRLPTEAEWELAAAASETRVQGAADPRVRERILRWYSAPNTDLPDVPHTLANLYGVHDLHGVIWEWVLDFSASTIAADDSGRNQFCGSSGTSSGDNTDYPAFMRAALRSSLKANYTLANLGFRCAADSVEVKP